MLEALVANLLGLVILLGGLIELMLLPIRGWLVWRLRRHGVHATGTVLDHVVDPGKLMRMGAEFVDQRGQTVSFITDRLDTPHGAVFAVGEQFDVLHLPTRPEDARPAKVPSKPPRRSLFFAYILLILYLIKNLQRLAKLVVAAFGRAILVAGKGQKDLAEKYSTKGIVAECRLQRRLRKHGIRARATVIWHEYSERRGTQKPGTRLLIGYVDRDWRMRIFQSEEREILPPIGREIQVIYDPEPSWAHHEAWARPQAAPNALIPDDIPPFTAFLVQFLLMSAAVVLGAFLLTIGALV